VLVIEVTKREAFPETIQELSKIGALLQEPASQ
jgi:hypothetical protein